MMRVRTGGERALAVQGLSPRHPPTPGPRAVVPLRLGSPIRDPAQTAASGGQWRTAVQSWRLSALRLRRLTRFLRPPGASPSAGLRAQPDQSTGSSAESQGPVISRPRQGPGPGRGCETRCAGSRPPEGRPGHVAPTGAQTPRPPTDPPPSPAPRTGSPPRPHRGLHASTADTAPRSAPPLPFRSSPRVHSSCPRSPRTAGGAGAVQAAALREGSEPRPPPAQQALCPALASRGRVRHRGPARGPPLPQN